MLQSMLEICERKVSNTQSSESHVGGELGAIVARPDPRPQSFAEQLAARVAGLQTGAASPHVTRRSLSSSGSIERSADADLWPRHARQTWPCCGSARMLRCKPQRCSRWQSLFQSPYWSREDLVHCRDGRGTLASLVPNVDRAACKPFKFAAASYP